MPRNPLRHDPTRTTTLRRRFMADMQRRFKRLRQLVVELVVKEDAFGLRPANRVHVANTRWAARHDPGKVREFREWLKRQIDAGVLEAPPGGGDPDEPWTAEYIQASYKTAINQGYTEANAARFDIDVNDPTLVARQEFVNQTFGAAESVRKMEMIYTRAYNDLKGVTDQMAQQLSAGLVEGLAEGRNPRDIARRMTKTIDGLSRGRANTIARTEIVRAHAEGKLDTYERMGITELGLLSEWLTAGDERVCPKCAPKEGRVYTIDEARGMIPLHPNCRCTWVPHVHVPTEEEIAELRREGGGPGSAASRRVLDRQKLRREEARRKPAKVEPDGVVSDVVGVDGAGADVAKVAAQVKKEMNEVLGPLESNLTGEPVRGTIRAETGDDGSLFRGGVNGVKFQADKAADILAPARQTPREWRKGYDSWLALRDKQVQDLKEEAAKLSKRSKAYRQLKRQIDELEQEAQDIATAVRPFVMDEAGDRLAAAASHEVAHVLDEHMFTDGQWGRSLTSVGVTREDLAKVSHYATTHPGEAWAESFAAYRQGVDMPDKVTEAVEKTLKDVGADHLIRQ